MSKPRTLQAMPKQWRPLAREFIGSGGAITHTGRGHLKWVLPSGEVVFSSATSSDSKRGILEHLRQLKRRGWTPSGTQKN